MAMTATRSRRRCRASRLCRGPKDVPDLLNIGVLAGDLLLRLDQLNDVGSRQRQGVVDQLGDGSAGNRAAVIELGKHRNVRQSGLSIRNVLEHAARKIV